MRDTTTSPAPWQLDFNDDFAAISDRDGTRILELHAYPSIHSDPKTVANANLIAAAPSLLEKLAQAVENLKDLRSGAWEPEEDEWDDVMQDFYQELSNATGMTVTEETNLLEIGAGFS